MANALYPIWKQELMQATANTPLNGSGTTGVYTSLLTASYVYSALHQFYASFIASPDAVVGTDQEIGATKTYANGTFDGADLTYTAVTGPVVTQLGLYVKNAGANTTWRLVCFLDTSVTGLPVTPNGGNITVTWFNNTGSPDVPTGIFTLSDGDAKENVVELGRVGAARVCAYNYKGERERQIGLIAQQVEQFAPHAVREFNGRRHVDYAAALLAA